MRRRILFADNNIDFLATRSEFLTPDYDVLLATDPSEAETILRTKHVHLAILDVRLVDDNDSADVSGLALAQKSEFRQIPKIILTGNATVNLVIDAMAPDKDGIAPALRFLQKDEGAAKLQQVVAEVFADLITVNWELRLRLSNGLSALGIAALVELNDDEAQTAETASELEDLFRQLFADRVQVTIWRLFSCHAGIASLLVTTHSEQHPELHYVVMCGRKEQIVAEQQQHVVVAPIQSDRSATFHGLETGIWLALSAYRFPNVSFEQIATLACHYRTLTTETLAMVIEDLLTVNLSLWHEESHSLQSAEQACAFFSQSGGLHSTYADLDWTHQLRTLCDAVTSRGICHIQLTADTLALALPDEETHTFPNPMAFGPASGQTPPYSTKALVHYGTIHGRLGGDTILISPQAKTYLIDHAAVDVGPLLYDYVSLECAIRLMLPMKTDISQRIHLEDLLAKCSELDDGDDIKNVDDALLKPLTAITLIRNFAATQVHSDIEQYHCALFYHLLAQLVRYDATAYYLRHELLSFVHLLIACAQLAKRWLQTEKELEIPLDPRTKQPFWLDTINREVWVEGACHSLTPREYLILQYMWERPNRLCGHNELAAVVDGLEVVEVVNIDWLIPAVSRLRRKIEPDSENPKYIHTIRGQGYKLIVPKA